MPTVHSSPYHMDNPALFSLLHHTAAAATTTTTTDHLHHHRKRLKPTTSSTTGGLFRMFKLFPMLTSGCKMVALLATGGRNRKPLLGDHATTATLFGHRKGRVTLTIQEDPHRLPIFVIELPLLTTAFHKEMQSEIVRIALESDTKTHKKKLLEEFVWAVFCNGRKVGYSIRRKQMSDDEMHVMQLLRGVSMGAGVLPSPPSEKEAAAADGGSGGGEMTYIRARFERVVGSKDSESLYMINPDGAAHGPELSIFFVRVR